MLLNMLITISIEPLSMQSQVFDRIDSVSCCTIP